MFKETSQINQIVCAWETRNLSYVESFKVGINVQELQACTLERLYKKNTVNNIYSLLIMFLK